MISIRRARSAILVVLVAAICMVWPVFAQDRQIRRNPQNDPAVMRGERRMAMVIGNADYKTTPLKNPLNDARTMGETLRELGFDVTVRENLNRKEMKAAVNTFGNKLSSGDVGLFYYSGHGMQVNGVNFLLPIGEQLESEADVEDDAVSLNGVLKRMGEANTRMNIVILDACRTPPPIRRSSKGQAEGLASVKSAPSGTLIAYATAPDTTASDGPGRRHSPYTEELVRAMKIPGLKLEDVFKSVRTAVKTATGGLQIPWETASLEGDFYFKLPAGGGPEGTQLAGGQAIIERPQPEMQQPVVGTGSLKVDSNPAGAAVYVDGQVRGKAPTSVTGLSVGKVNVRVMLDGYKPQEKTIDVRYGKEVQASFILDREEKRAEQKPGQTWREPITGMEFVWVPGGCYQMGCGPWTSECSANETPVHQICVDGFWMGRTEVTQDQWMTVMKSNPSNFNRGGKYPVEKVSWDDAKHYIKKLEGLSGNQYKLRLPTEAEWEYTCRSGGKAQKYAGANDVGGVAWFEENSDSTTHPVAGKAANGLGLFDMSGNVWEWCEDVYSSEAYGRHLGENPVYTEGDYNFWPQRVIRGGSWNFGARDVRCGKREQCGVNARGDRLGFRLVRSP